MFRLTVAAAVVAATIVVAIALRSQSSATVAVQLLAFNDFHGHLHPPDGSNGRIGGVPAGGVEYLSTHLAALRRRNPNTLVVSAGDNIGASTLLSGLFHDEPAIEALNAAGLDIASVGNHEFDEGWSELRRMRRGGCHPVDGCQDKTPFDGAKFTYLAANVELHPDQVDDAARRAAGWPDTPDETTIFPPFVVREIGGVRIAFVGMTLKGTPQIVTASSTKGLTFDDEAETMRRLVPALDRQGVRAIVLLVHEGGMQTVAAGQTEDVDGCADFHGGIVNVVNRLDPAIGVIVSGHTHRAYNCTIGGRLVTSAASFGRVITDIELEIDRATDRIVAKKAHNVIVTRDVAKDPAETAIIEHYQPFYAPFAQRVVGRITASFPRRASAAGETALGDLVADAQLETARRVAGPDVAFAFMNNGGLRADLNATNASGTSDVTYEDIYGVQPFGNGVMVKTMTGDTIRRLLESQLDPNTGNPRNILQVSNGFTYRYDSSRPAGQRVEVASMRIGGRPIDLKASYRVAMNDFIGGGGDGFAIFTEGTSPVSCGPDIDALERYLGAHSPVSPATTPRILRANR